MNVHGLIDVNIMQSDAVVGANLSTMSSWKFWFPDDLSPTGEGSLFDATDYDNVSDFKLSICNDFSPNRVGTLLDQNSEPVHFKAKEHAVSSPTINAATNNTFGVLTRKQVPRLIYSCSICARTFASEKYLSMHTALHRKSTLPSQLPALPKITRENSTLEKLTVMEQESVVGTVGKTKWTCEVCFKYFAHNSNYKNHIRTHSDERPFVCHVCSIGFKERYHLKKHTLFKHTAELNEACRQCGKRFKDSTAVRAHERIHSELRPYSCERCRKAFKTSECLWHHDHRSKTCGRTKHLFENRVADVASCNTDNSSGYQPASTTQVNLAAPPPAMNLIPLHHNVSGLSVPQQYQPPSSNFSYSVVPMVVSTSLSPDHLCIIRETNVSNVKSENVTLPDVPSSCIHQVIPVNDNHNCKGPLYTFIDSTLPRINSPVTPHSSCQSDAASGTFIWTQHGTSKPVVVVVDQQVVSSNGVTIATKCTNNSAKQKAMCSRCGKQFASPLAFERHLAVHSETRPYRCQLCDVGFKLKVHLKKHNLYRHNTEYPCQCGICGKLFKDSSAVRLHERIHSTARPFQCACGKSFKTRENLWGHSHRRPCATRFGVDSRVTALGNFASIIDKSTTRLLAGNTAVQPFIDEDVIVNKTTPPPPSPSPVITPKFDDSSSKSAIEQRGTTSSFIGMTLSCGNVVNETETLWYNQLSSPLMANCATITRHVKISSEEKPSEEFINETCQSMGMLNALRNVRDSSVLTVVSHSSLPAFETLMPALHYSNTSGTYVTSMQPVSISKCPPMSLNNVSSGSTIPSSRNAIKLPCIEHLFDRSTRQPNFTRTTSLFRMPSSA